MPPAAWGCRLTLGLPKFYSTPTPKPPEESATANRQDPEHRPSGQAPSPGVAALLEVLTMRLGPDTLIVAARVAFDDDIIADQVEDLSDAIDARLARHLAVAAHVFLDPTQLTSSAPAPCGAARGTPISGDVAVDNASMD